MTADDVDDGRGNKKSRKRNQSRGGRSCRCHGVSFLFRGTGPPPLRSRKTSRQEGPVLERSQCFFVSLLCGDARRRHFAAKNYTHKVHRVVGRIGRRRGDSSTRRRRRRRRVAGRADGQRRAEAARRGGAARGRGRASTDRRRGAKGESHGVEGMRGEKEETGTREKGEERLCKSERCFSRRRRLLRPLLLPESGAHLSSQNRKQCPLPSCRRRPPP